MFPFIFRAFGRNIPECFPSSQSDFVANIKGHIPECFHSSLQRARIFPRPTQVARYSSRNALIETSETLLWFFCFEEKCNENVASVFLVFFHLCILPPLRQPIRTAPHYKSHAHCKSFWCFLNFYFTCFCDWTDLSCSEPNVGCKLEVVVWKQHGGCAVVFSGSV